MKQYFVYNYVLQSTNDDEAVRKCLEDASVEQSRTIVFDRKDYLLSCSVQIPSNTTVLIDGCTVKQADNTYDTLFRGNNLVLSPEDPYGTPLQCNRIENIRIIGKNDAKISGPDKNRRGFHPILQEEQEMVGDFWGWRTLTISLSNCHNFEISGLTFEKSRCWTMSFDLCSNGYIHDLSIFTNVKNGDGIDFRSGCSYCKVENIQGTTSDDTVACTALYREGEKYPLNNYLYTHEPSRCITGGEERKNIHHISIRNVKSNGNHHSVICLAANGCKVHDITVENVEETPKGVQEMWREATVKVYTGYGSDYKKGDIHSILINNIKGTYAEKTVYSNADVENAILKNIQHSHGTGIVLDKPDGFVVL